MRRRADRVRTRTYTDVPGTAQTLRTYTIEAGNQDASADNQRMGFAFVEEWQLRRRRVRVDDERNMDGKQVAAKR